MLDAQHAVGKMSDAFLSYLKDNGVEESTLNRVRASTEHMAAPADGSEVRRSTRSAWWKKKLPP